MLLSASTIFLSAFLLFQIQPMIAKMILPWFGGSAAVWITAMLFFQTVLLGGYLYAHWSVSRLRPGMQALLHAALLAASLLLLPVAPAVSWKPAGTEEPLFRILGLLLVSVGLPYFLLATTTPLVQAWYTRQYRNAIPYRLFALSNLASLAGLIAYPLVLEPAVTLRQQSIGWSAAYAAFAVMAGAAGIRSVRGDADSYMLQDSDRKNPDGVSKPPAWREKTIWFLLAACASTLLLAVTNHLTQNIASIPFLWVLPLSLYLLTFVLTFDFERFYNRRIFTLLMLAALAGMAWGLIRWNSHTSLKLVIPTFSGGLFLCCMYCHGELVRRKPVPRFLTAFYLMLSLGGAAGGLLVGLAAPNVLSGYFELPLVLSAAAVLALILLEYRRERLLAAASWIVAAAVLFAGGKYVSDYKKSALVTVRNFYGGLRVNQYDTGTEDEARILVHGTVDHGMQFVRPERRREHITYYGERSGIALALRSRRPAALRVGVIGLGAGSLASYGRPGDVFRFYEINPLVETIARSQFTYLADCRGRIEIVPGDGRLSLEREQPQQYDVLAVDAFSGDAVPVHLLTRQAIALYFRHLKPCGIVALHITNTHLDLGPVVETLRRELGKQAVVVVTEKDPEEKIYISRWALLSSCPLDAPLIAGRAEPLPFRPELRAWTDDYNNLFQILK